MNNQKGIECLGSGQYRQAIEYLRRALDESPDNLSIKQNLSNAYNNYGFSFFKSGELLNAIDNFEKAVYFNRNNVYALINLGQAYYKKNDLKKAADFLRKAYALEPGFKGLKALLDKINGETSLESGVRKLETMHFIIVSDDSINIDNFSNVRIILEEAYSRVGAFFDCFPKEKTGVIVYSDENYKRIKGNAPYWSHAHFDGKIRIPLGNRIYSRDFLSKIIYHEYAHAVIRVTGGKNTPLWLNEGLACYAETLIVPVTRDFLKSYIKKETFIPFEKLPSSYNGIGGNRDANLIYREFLLLATFIIDRYSNYSMRAMLRSFGEGKEFANVLEDVLSLTPDEFSRDWKLYVKNKLGF